MPGAVDEAWRPMPATWPTDRYAVGILHRLEETDVQREPRTREPRVEFELVDEADRYKWPDGRVVTADPSTTAGYAPPPPTLRIQSQ